MFYQENKWMALRKSILIISILLFTCATVFLANLYFVVYTGITLEVLFLILFLYPFSVKTVVTDSVPNKRFDERDIMFSRKELIPGTKKYDLYYERFPDREILDNAFRKEPGLLSHDSIYYNKKAYSAAKDFFRQIDELHLHITGEKSREETKIDPAIISAQIKKMGKDLGALDVGLTSTNPYHFYSIKGRGKEYGNEIELRHTYAIAFTVEMDHEMVMAAPQASIVMESAKQYLNAGKIAIQIAKLIREMGYDARAHIDGNYQVICPLVARDAGLGEIGRMGLLMTPDYGPRVRIGVVTTNMRLKTDEYKKQHDVLDFCLKCKKCADCCPGNSIPDDDPKIIDGLKRWKINSESCYTFWCKAGTDCGRCMSVCPYSHPNNTMHSLIRKGINHSKFFRNMALILDDFFYGKKPLPKALPEELQEG